MALDSFLTLSKLPVCDTCSQQGRPFTLTQSASSSAGVSHSLAILLRLPVVKFGAFLSVYLCTTVYEFSLLLP